MKSNKLLIIVLCLLAIACTKEEETINLPSSYSFENVNFSGQTERLAMLTEMITEMKKGKTQNLDANVLLNMYANANSPFTNATLNASTKQLKNKTYEADIVLVENLINYLASISTHHNTAVTTSGTNGVATSTTNTSRSYLVDSNGIDLVELVQKTIMGAVFYYRIAEEYTTYNKLATADNNTVVDGEGTAMQHYWDEAFGYMGIPTNVTVDNYDAEDEAGNLIYYGEYVNSGKPINLLSSTLHSFIQGRDAINRRDYTVRDVAAANVRKNVEYINVCAMLHYLNSARTNYDDYAVRCHVLSEALGFFLNLKYNANKIITDTDYNAIKDYFLVNENWSVAHLNTTQLTYLRDTIAEIYGLEDYKTLF
ncbi:MAG: DUF4856 domain-containing protein [Chitinophagales bacterium]|nr:DUF4856 domain-containing protein [Chitinophagales bacterium]